MKKTTTRRTTRHIARGFTLIELVVVVAILGVLISIVAPNVIGTKDGANAQLLVKTASNVSTNWSLLNQACGTSSAITGSPLPAGTQKTEEVVFGGLANVNATYKNCYAQSKILALTEVSQPGTAAGTYNVAGYLVTFSDGGILPLKITYTSVPETLATLMVQKYDPKVETLTPGGATVGGVISYTAITSGLTNVTIIKQI